MKHLKILLYILTGLLMLGLAQALIIVTDYNNTYFSPTLSNVTWRGNHAFNATSINITDWCVIIDGGDYNGSYCDTSPTPIFLYFATGLHLRIYDEDTGVLIVQNVTIQVTSGSGVTDTWTMTGTKSISGLPNGYITILTASSGYGNRTVNSAIFGDTYLNIYMSRNSQEVVLQINDKDTGRTIENATIILQRYYNLTWHTVLTLYSDVTGRTKTTVNSNAHYHFIVTHPDYELKEFDLNPVLFSSYFIYMTSTESLIDSSDFAGVTLSHTPTTYRAGLNNVSAVFGSGTGGLTAYRATVKYPTGTQTKTGILANGETLNFNFTTAPTSITDKVIISMEYMKAGDSAYRQFNYSYSLMNTSQFGTIMGGMQGTYGLGLFERILIATILILMLGGVATYYGGVSAGSVVGLFVMGYFAYIGFISKWLVVIPIFAGLIILAQRSQTQ